MNHLVQLNGKWPHKQLKKKVLVNKEETLKITVKGTYGHNFYVPMVTIHNALCRKERALSRRKWGHWDIGHVILHDPSVWLTTLGAQSKATKAS